MEVIGYSLGMKKFVFGPVPSRRLGFSLGVDIIPRKCCTFDCIYCQVGRTTHKSDVRASFYKPEEIIDEITREVAGNRSIDFITFSGSGEPTLNSDLGRIIKGVKKRATKPVAVITNGSLLDRSDVRRDLEEADLLMPSLDAVTEEIFSRVNRPVPTIRIEAMIEGLRALRRQFRGPLWLEVMLMQDINDDAQHIELLKKTINTINADRVQLNTVTRPPCEGYATGLTPARLATIQGIFGPGAEVICSFGKEGGVENPAESWVEDLLAMLRRRSLTLNEIVAVTGVSRTRAEEGLKKLVDLLRLEVKRIDDRDYYLVKE